MTPEEKVDVIRSLRRIATKVFRDRLSVHEKEAINGKRRRKLKNEKESKRRRKHEQLTEHEKEMVNTKRRKKWGELSPEIHGFKNI